MTADGHPSFSIVIPTYRRPRQLAACLESLAALDYPRERYEVIVVDDDGGVPLDADLERSREQLDVTVLRTIDRGARHGGPAAARNLGARRAEGEVLAFTDDDCLPDPRWLDALGARFTEAPDRAVGGRTVNLYSATSSAKASQLILDCVYAFYNADASHARFFPSNNLAVPREGFLRVGGFDPAFRISEDRDLCDRWLQRGSGMAYARDAVVYHTRTFGFPGFVRQYFDYGRGAWRYHRERAARGGGRLQGELDFYRTLVRTARAPLREATATERSKLVALLGLWQAANAAGFAWEGLSSLVPTAEGGGE